jgi:hypothetical protein
MTGSPFTSGGSVERKAAKFLWLVSAGALLGAVIATWLAPKSIIWYFTPPVQFGVNCQDPIRWALRKMMIAQGLGLLIGALFGIMGFIIVWRRAIHRRVDDELPPQRLPQ